MLIKLTFADANKNEFWISTDQIVSLQRSQKNLLETLVVTSLLGPQGPQAFAVLESPETVAYLVNSSKDNTTYGTQHSSQPSGSNLIPGSIK